MHVPSSKLFVILGLLLAQLLALPIAFPGASQVAAQAPADLTESRGVALDTGDTICLMGNALAERMQHHGWLETRLQLRFPDLDLSVRNLGFSTDELTVHQRTAGFGSWDDYLDRCDATVIFAFFGGMESFGGREKLDDFKRDLALFIDHTRKQQYDGKQAPKLVLFSPIAVENTGDPNLPEAREANLRLRPYVEAMSQVAAVWRVPFVDLYTPTLKRFTEWRSNRIAEQKGSGQPLRAARAVGDASANNLTINGMHLTERGNSMLAAVIEKALFAEFAQDELDMQLAERVREEVLAKNLMWFNRYRATDGYNVYGGRSSLKYVDDVSNYEVLQREMEVLDATALAMDKVIHGLARGEEPTLDTSGIPPLIPVVTNRPGDGPDGAHLFRDGEEAIEAMTLADGMRANLFADEQQFPILANPVQMAWDTSDRLWVAVWPTYPHWEPGQPMNDALVVLEDTDGDGRADTCVPFADDLHNPTGFEFFNDGVIVANPPDLLFLKDTDGDGRADVRQRILHGLSSADTHHSANSFVFGPDGAFYFQEGVFHQSQVESVNGPVRNRDACVWRFEPRTWRVERYVPYGFANPHGHVFDRWGQDFVTDGTGNVNYYALPFSGHVEHPAKKASYFPFFQQRSRPAGATEILSSNHFPEANQGNYLIANVIGFQGIFQYEMLDAGSGFGATEVQPIVHSSDPNFRPVDIEVGPDGALYLLDWQAPLIGHMQHHLRDPSRDHAHGRIYRITSEGRALDTPPPIADRPVEELLPLLTHPVDRVRIRARIELSGRRLVPARLKAFRDSLDPEHPDHEHNLLEVLWLSQQHQILDLRLLDELLEADDPRARAAATRVLRQMRDEVPGAIVLLQRRIADEHPRVRLETVVALSFFSSSRAAEIALTALDKPMDPFLEYALDETMRTLEPHWRSALVAGEPFADEHTEGLAYVLSRLTTPQLRTVRPSEQLFAELLSRHGLEPEEYLRAIVGLAEEHGRRAADELILAIERADARGDGHADHLLSSLFRTIDLLEPNLRHPLGQPLQRLGQTGRRGATRRLAIAAQIAASHSYQFQWLDALRTMDAMTDFLEAIPLIADEHLRDSLFPRVRNLLDVLPPKLQEQSDAAAGATGRYVRIDLPGAERTLTLAEVEVLSGGRNIASRGSATQSTVNWDGHAERALDGNTSGTWSHGGQTHTLEDQPDPWWELDLGREYPIEAITVWNRTQLPYAKRLDGFTLSLLDDNRRNVFEMKGIPAPEVKSNIELSAPELRMRRAALLTLASIGVRQAEAVDALLARYDDPQLQGAAVQGMRLMPFDVWSAEQRATLQTLLQATFETANPATFIQAQDKELLALADELQPHLPEDEARVLARVRDTLGPLVIVIRPVPDALLYDRAEFTVAAGRPVEIVFDNTDLMPHNLVITEPGALATVGLAAEDMAADADAWARAFVPDEPAVLYATRLLQPGESQTLSFLAPNTIGDHPYVCTFPGHWVRMNGLMKVVRPAEAREANDAPLAAEPQADTPVKRDFVRFWSPDDLRPHLSEVTVADPHAGSVIFEAARCQLCHQVGGVGGETGPDLIDVVGRHDRAALMTQILDPSGTILEGYESETIVTHGGGISSGRVLHEDDQVVRLQTDPYKGTWTEIPKSEIARRRTSTVSTMPDGLLSTFTQDEILALIAYLESLREET